MSVADHSNRLESASSSTDSYANTSYNAEGRLGNYFHKAVSKTVDKFIAYFKFSSTFKVEYPDIYKRFPSDLVDLHKQLISQLKDTVLNEVNNLCAETNLHTSFYLLDEIIKKNSDKSNGNSWRPTGDPENDVQDHIHPLKKKHIKYLEFILQTMLVENAKLEETARENHLEIMELKKEVDYHNKDIQNNFSALTDGSILKLGEDIHAIFDKD